MTTTPNYGWTLPAINADADTWGTELNSNLSSQDTQVKAISDAAAAAATTANAALVKTNNLSDIPSASTARTNLGLGTAATAAASAAGTLVALSGSATVGHFVSFNATNGTVQDSTYTTASFDAAGAASTAQAAAIAAAAASSCQRASNLSDVTSVSTSRTNLGLKNGATTTIFIQSGGSPSGGVDGDLFFIY